MCVRAGVGGGYVGVRVLGGEGACKRVCVCLGAHVRVYACV